MPLNLYNFSCKLCTIVCVFLISWKNMEGFLTASPSTTRVTFSTAINAHSTTARVRVQLVYRGIIPISNDEARNTASELLGDLTKNLACSGKRHLLVTTTFAARKCTFERTFHSKDLFVSDVILCYHLFNINSKRS